VVAAALGALAAAGCGHGNPPARAASGTTPSSTTAPVATTSTTTTSTTSVPPPTAAPTTVPPARPPFAITEVTVPLVDASRPTVSHGRTISAARSLPTEVWVPAAPGRRPLIVFAPGFDVGPDAYGTLLATWAAHGYVVAAPEFPLTDPAIAGANLDEADINNQPADVRFVTDALVAASSPVAARVDPGRVAMAGHSDGAETALAAAVTPAPAGQPRFRALVAMSAQQVSVAGATANPPLLVTQGDADTINPPSYGYQVWQAATSPKYLLVLHGGGHLPPLQAGSVWLPGVEAVTLAFLDAYLAGDATVAGLGQAVAGSTLFQLQAG
jgi:dienelactone hydrolase